MKAWKMIAILATAILVPGGVFIGIGLNSLMKICYNISKYEVKKWNFDFIDLIFTLQVKNPSQLKVGIEGYDIQIALNDVDVARVKSNTKKILESEKTSFIELPVKIDIKKTFGQLKNKEIISYFATQNYAKIIVSLKGKLNGRLLKVSIPVKINTSITLEQIIKQMDSPSQPC